MYTFLAIVLLVFTLKGAASAKCLPIEEAVEHVGEIACVASEVKSVSEAKSGIIYLNFCDDWRTCPFSVVVFPRDLRDIGDVRQLKGRQIEISGKIRHYNNRTEIILKDAAQLRGEAANLPPVPKEFLAERQGRFSAGQFKHDRSGTRTQRRRPGAPVESGSN